MANWRALTIQAGQQTQIQDVDSLIVGAGVLTSAGNLTITPAGGTISAAGNLSLTANSNLSFAGGTSAADFSSGSGLFKTSTGAVTIGTGAVTISGTTTFTAASTALTVNNNAAITGTLTNSGAIFANGGVDRGAVNPLALGATNASAVNIGNGTITTTVTGNIDVVAAGALAFQQFEAGDNAGVSTGASGRIRYNTGSLVFEVSLNGGAYTPIATGQNSPWSRIVANISPTVTTDTVTIGTATLLASERLRVTAGTSVFDFTSTTAFEVTQTGGATPALVVDTTNSRVGIATAPTSATLHVAQPAAASGTPVAAFLVVGGAHTGLTASAEAISINFNLAQTVQFATGALATQRAVRIQAPTYAFVGASTITTASTFAITGAPIAGTNATITNAFALDVGGATRINDSTAGALAFQQMEAGQNSAVSPSNTGRIRYNATSQVFEVSLNGAAYTALATGSSSGPWTRTGTNIGPTTTTDSVTVGSASLTASEFFGVKQQVTTSGSPTIVLVTGAANTTLAASAESTDINFNLARTVQFATGTLTTQRAVRIQAPTYAFVGSSTLTTASTLAISGVPVAGTNATITNAFALDVGGGARFNDSTAGNLAYIQMEAGQSAPVSPSSIGRIRYNAGTNKFEISQNGAAYAIILPWLRAGTNIAPTTISDSVTIGATALLDSEIFRVSGAVVIDNSGSTAFRVSTTGTLTSALTVDTTNTRVGIGIGPIATLDIDQPDLSGGTAKLIRVQGGHNTALTASTEVIDIDFNLAHTVQWSTGAIGTQRAVRIVAPTYAFVGASTITTASTFAVTDVPQAGANATITNAFAIDSGGAVRINNGSNLAYLQMETGQSSAVSPSNTGRIRYNVTAQAFEISQNGSAYSALIATSGSTLGFFGATPVTQQVDGNNLTNNVTSGGTTSQIDDFTNLTVYATDAATIRNDIFQLARTLKIVNDALRLYGLLT